MIETIGYKGKHYPRFQASGNAARFVMPFAQEVCNGYGLDIGTGKSSWGFPGSVHIDPHIEWDNVQSTGMTGTAVNCDTDNPIEFTEGFPWEKFDGFKRVGSGRLVWYDKDWNAMNLPKGPWDYIFSSHCLEHIQNPWCEVLDYWFERLVTGGVMFLYLPHPDQEYWLPWNNRKHVHIIYPEDIEKYFKSGPYCRIFVSQRDLNHSFAAMAQKI